MRFKDFKLGQKLGISFGVLILISVILGGLAVFNMTRVSTKSQHLAEEYIPEVRIASSLERNSLITMFNMRGYAFAEEEHYLNQGMASLDLIKQDLKDARDLQKESTELQALEESIDVTTENVTTYEQLAKETVTTNENLAQLRNKMDEAAASFMENCYTYLERQNTQMQSELQQGVSNTNRLEKITLINNIIDKGNSLRVANFKAQANRDPASYESAYKNFAISEELSNLRATTTQTNSLTVLSNIEQSGNDYKSAMENFLTTWKKREDLNTERGEAANLVLENAENISNAGVDNTSAIAGDAVKLLSSSSMIMIVGLGLALLIGVALAFFLTNLITSPIKKGVAFAQEIAKGNLNATVDVDQKDEIGILAQALRNMVKKLQEIVGDIINGATNIAGASQQMSATSQQMSQGANEQASSTEEVSSSIEEMSSNIEQNTENAQQTERIAVAATKGIQEVNEASKKSLQSIHEIAEKISIVNDIAFQTNILALNAAVEAARAGEHGKGFAVVAAEVRKLAERSGSAAKEIDELSKNSVSVTEEAGKLTADILPEIERTSGLVKEITAASIEQNSGADQINNAIQQLNQVVQQNASASEEMATSSEELSSQADQLKDIISFFKIQGLKLDIKHHGKSKKIHTARLQQNDSQKPGDNGDGGDNQSKEKGGVNINMNGGGDEKDNEYENF